MSIAAPVLLELLLGQSRHALADSRQGGSYVIAFTDSDGVPLTGATNYRLNLPRNAPAANFWSVTLYEAENASGLANGQPFPSLDRETSRSRTPMAAPTST